MDVEVDYRSIKEVVIDEKQDSSTRDIFFSALFFAQNPDLFG